MLIKSKNKKTYLLLLNCEKQKHENQKANTLPRSRMMTADKAPFPGLNNTVTSIPAWAEVHYWDTSLLTSSVGRKKRKKKIREKPRIVSIPISQQEFQGHGFIYMACAHNFVLYAGKLYLRQIIVYFFHMYPTTASLKVRINLRDFSEVS